MKMLTENLKRVLAGLAHQDAAEFLSTGDKMKVLGAGAETEEQTREPARKIARKPAGRRIALISDGRGLGAPLDYVVDAGVRQGATIDLLIHRAVDPAAIQRIENRIRAAGLASCRIWLGMKPVDDIVTYICNHPSLILVVGMPDDDSVKVLVEEVIPKRGGRVPVPLALIEDRSSTRATEQSAA